MTAATPRWDIFCRVVDNFGDAGVSWRLARLLAAEHGAAVTLWLDRLEALAALEPALAPASPTQHLRGVTVRRWAEPLSAAAPVDVVVDAFGGGLPDGYAEAMAARVPPPRWFIVEYLSAEPWVDGAHSLASPHPRLPLTRHFWFPGFTERTGGLLRERALLEECDAFQRSAALRSAFWSSVGLPEPAAGELRASVFCYDDAPLPALLDAWADGARPVAAVLPQGVAAQALERWRDGGARLAPGAPVSRGCLTLHAIPFLPQDGYDRLLWACDLNFVRGEDSLVRAQWAARPFVWQAYPQGEGAHHPKRDALLERYAAALDAPAALALRRLWDAWNRDPRGTPLASAWTDFAAALPRLEAHAKPWSQQLARLPEFASGLFKVASAKV
jgi:uncharacterized repeat protein (TIGR03837 family)